MHPMGTHNFEHVEAIIIGSSLRRVTFSIHDGRPRAVHYDLLLREMLYKDVGAPGDIA
jgi:hypothetical protein